MGRFDESNPERLRELMEVNFFATVEWTRDFLPALRQGNRPAVVLVGSVLALAAVPHKSEYCASKFALAGWAESVRPELAHEGIDVLAVHPSTTKSEFFDHVLGDATLQKSAAEMTPEQAAQYIVKAVKG